MNTKMKPKSLILCLLAGFTSSACLAMSSSGENRVFKIPDIEIQVFSKNEAPAKKIANVKFRYLINGDRMVSPCPRIDSNRLEKPKEACPVQSTLGSKSTDTFDWDSPIGTGTSVTNEQGLLVIEKHEIKHKSDLLNLSLIIEPVGLEYTYESPAPLTGGGNKRYRYLCPALLTSNFWEKTIGGALVKRKEDASIDNRNRLNLTPEILNTDEGKVVATYSSSADIAGAEQRDRTGKDAAWNRLRTDELNPKTDAEIDSLWTSSYNPNCLKLEDGE